MRCVAWVWRAALLSASAGAAFGQGVDLLYPNETDFYSNRGIERLIDLDGDGRFDSCGERVADFARLQNTPCLISQTGNSCANVRDVAYATVGGVATVYWVRTDTDLVERGADADGDGRIEASEQSVFFSFPGSFPGFAGFVGQLAIDSTGAVWVTTNSSTAANQGLYRLRDADGSGAATLGTVVGTEPEVVNFLPATFTVPDAPGTGTVSLPSNNFRAVAVDALDNVIAFEATNGVYVRVRDLDGDFAYDVGEAANFYYAAPCLAALKQNPDVGTAYPNIFDFGTNAFCAWTSGPCAAGSFGNVMRMVHTSLSATAQPLYWFASTSSAAFPCYKGLVLRARDLNANGDINDAGEVTLFYNGSLQSGVYGTGPTPLVDGTDVFFVNILEDFGAVGEAAYIFENAGPDCLDNRERLGFGAVADTIWRLADGNADGDADDAGEQTRVATLQPSEMWGPRGKIVPVPSSAFAVPSSHRIRAPGCPAPLSPFPDTELRAQIGGIGNPSIGTTFTVTLRESPISGGGLLGVGAGVLVIGSAALNIDLGVIAPISFGCILVPFPDVLLSVPLTPSAAPFTWPAIPIPPNSAPVAETTVPIPIPPDPSFVGACLWLQWGVIGLDPSFAPAPFVSTAMEARLGL
ncbi:MAG: hypothetical protein ACREIU_02600 [Planctomycetota bacterium]